MDAPQPAHPRDRLIIALDLPNAPAAQAMVSKLGNEVSFYKVGLQLFIAEGPALVRELVRGGKRVFLDLKLHDIPNTVSGAICSLADLNVSMVTVHTLGGSKMLSAAAEAAASLPAKPIVLGVTVLTSMTDSDLHGVQVRATAANQALHLAGLAKSAGCGGVVASPQEAQALRKLLGDEMAIVTPGIRPVGSDTGDQARVATPREAIDAGATHIVVGRPVTHAPDPAAAAAAILAELSRK
jgi:orotidine-5'-phosphate decarboxylase